LHFALCTFSMQPWEILDKFTGHLRDALARAIAVATEVGSPHVAPVHLLYSLALQKGSVAHEILHKVNLTTEAMQPYLTATPVVKKEPITAAATVTIPELTPHAKQALERAMLIAADYEHAHVGTEHLLSGILHIKNAPVQTLLERLHITPKRIEKHLENILQSTSRFPLLEDIDEMVDDMSSTDTGLLPLQTKDEKKSKKKQTKMLDYFATELTNSDAQKNIDPVIGREEEIDRVIHILARRTKNNPVLLGEPGVGKTAIAEGLAKKIMNGDVPDTLLGKRLYALDIGLVIAGTIYRGEFETRLKQIIDEVTADPNIILFIDELHTIVGTGSTQGSMDAANILKPALARGHIRCIGATTIDEYKKYIESDPALERRFQAIFVDEPTLSKAHAILQGVKVYYEQFHGVNITKRALWEAVELSDRFIQNAHLPDKALDLIDEAAAGVRVRGARNTSTRKMHALRKQIQELRRQKEEAVYNEQFDQALKLKKDEKNLIRKLNTVKHESRATVARPRITRADIARVVSRITNLPIEHVMRRGHDLYVDLEKKLGSRVLGQENAAHTVADRLRVAAAGLHDERRPFASFLFVGPSGVGKTELAKQLAATLYPNRNGLIRLDMSEFSEGFGVSKLLGAPAGYVGYREATPVLDRLKHQPHSIVLFDNIDKAHRDVMRLLLQILEEGEITDSAGKAISFKQAVIILTATTEKRLFDVDGIGFSGPTHGEEEKKIPAALSTWLKEVLGDELVGRMDAVVPFKPLSRETLKRIITLHIDALNQQLKKQSRRLLVTQPVIDLLIAGIQVDHGARMVRSLVSERLVATLTKHLTRGARGTITAHVTDGTISLHNE